MNEISYNNIHATLSGSPEAKAAAAEFLTFRVEGYQFTAAFKKKRWDGYKCIYNRQQNTFPTGLVHEVAGAVGGASIRDLRERPNPTQLGPTLSLTLQPHQEEAVTRIVQATRGVVQHPVGAGKSIVIVEAVRRLAVKTLILVGRKELLHQQIKQFDLLRRTNYMVGQMGDGTSAARPWTVGTIQTLIRRLRTLRTWQPTVDWLQQFEAVFIDECHHLPADSYNLLMRAMPNAYYRIGLSATPFAGGDRERQLAVTGLTGPVISYYDSQDGIDMDRLVPADVFLVDPGAYPLPKDEKDYRSEVTHGIVEHKGRNQAVVDLAGEFGALGPTLVLTERIEHGRNLRAMMLDEGHTEVK